MQPPEFSDPILVCCEHNQPEQRPEPALLYPSGQSSPSVRLASLPTAAAVGFLEQAQIPYVLADSQLLNQAQQPGMLVFEPDLASEVLQAAVLAFRIRFPQSGLLLLTANAEFKDLQPWLPAEILVGSFGSQELLLRLNLLRTRLRAASVRPDADVQQRFEQMFEKHDAVMLLINPEQGQIMYANRAAAKFYGYTRQELQQMQVSDLNTLSLAEIKIEMERARQELKNAFVFTHRLADGQLRTVEVHSTPLEVAGQQLLFSVIHDITQRQQAEAALQASEARYRQIVETAEEGIWVIDKHNLTSFANQKMAVMLGYAEPAELLGRSMFDFMEISSYAQAAQNVERRRAGLREEHDFKFKKRDGTLIWTHLSTSPIFDVQGEYAGALAMVTDISERKRWEQELEQALHERETLLREIHHRVKNNFQIMLSLLRMQERRLPQSEQALRLPLRTARQRIRTMALIHEQLYHTQDLSRIELTAYLRQILRELQSQQPRDIQPIEVELDLQSVQLDIDQAIACGLLANELLSNAFRFAFPPDFQGTRCIWIHLSQREAEVTLEIGDTGIGLAESNQQAEEQSFGLHLVQQLCQQIGARFSQRVEAGICWQIVFSVLNR